MSERFFDDARCMVFDEVLGLRCWRCMCVATQAAYALTEWNPLPGWEAGTTALCCPGCRTDEEAAAIRSGVAWWVA